MDEYVRIEELPSGNGYVDIAFLPKAYSNNPAMVIELKWNKTSQTALDQIYNKKYPSVFENYRGDVLLIGINYDTSSKQHTCKIERKGI
ncbi:PD-(D/E)XK nuclease domain-containing protein [Butyrivibrio fibrisolvens]|uniref:PD-(D/E)XK nuclease domain-containing protein n=1 Tax=Butyrivibrio fibrisolvens TaxID=831 RepID=UPI003B5030A3